jgi:hypothetical protein
VAHEPLRALKETFPHASFEALARRCLAFRQAVLTIFDNGTVTRRLASDGFAAPQRPMEWEWEVVQRCYEDRMDLAGSFEGLEMQATYVDDGRGVVRVLLFTEEG